jgi:hypothetical protein
LDILHLAAPCRNVPVTFTLYVMNRGAAKVWQALGTGEGFERNGVGAGFEISGFVWAKDANEAWQRAISIASSQWTELAQADREGRPPGQLRAVINADEVQDASGLQFDPAEIDCVELTWDGEGNDV